MTVESHAEDWVMDRDYIDAHHVVDRYVLGKLSDADTDAFERAMLDDPGLQDQVELAEAMQAQIKLAAPRLEPVPTPALEPIAPWYRRLSLVTMAMALALGLPLLSSLSTISELRREIAAPVALGPAIFLDTTRGTVQATRVPANQPVVLRIDIGPAASGAYLLKMDGHSDTEITAYPDQRHRVSMLVKALTPGRYSVEIRSVEDTTAAMSFEVIAE